jgi:hypothetical protein
MDIIKNFIISISPNGEYYKNLLFENCINDNNNIIENTIFRDALFDLIIYGNMISRSNKKLSVHSRLHTIDDSDKQQIANEFEKFQRIKLHFHWIILICLGIITFQNIYLFKEFHFS